MLLLLYFKYLNFGITNINRILGTDIGLKKIILPLGISFFTFQQIAYLVSIYKGETELRVIDYVSYILFFPKLLMGPLMEPTDFIKQINDPERKRVNAQSIAVGLKISSIGLVKKALLADTFSQAVLWGKDHIHGITSGDCLLIMLFYTFEIYFDFSGYSDMAVGISRMMNIELPINFDSPYKALSIKDFWKRWHISLTQFFTKYIYIPLGGSRKGKLFTYLNVMIVFSISGLWHGSQWTFIIWGVLHGLLCILDRILDEKKIEIFQPFRLLITFGIVNVLWLLFNSDSVGQWLNMLLKILRIDDNAFSPGLLDVFEIPESHFLIDLFHLRSFYYTVYGFCMIIFLVTSMIICFVPQNGYRTKEKLTPLNMITTAILFVWGVLSLGGVSTFVYNGF